MTDQQKYTNVLQNSHILVIGGTSGIGFCVAEACVEYGAVVTISSSSPARVEEKVKALKQSYPSATDRVHGIVADLSKRDTLESDLKNMLDNTVTNLEGSKLDHVVFTAGDPLATMALADMTMEKILAAGQIRFFAPLLLAKFLQTYLVKSERSSYTITSGGIAEHPAPNWSVVSAYAGGHSSMTRNLALDLKPIRVNCVQPGAVDTELWKMTEEQKKTFLDYVRKNTATGRIGSPEDVAKSFLAVLTDNNMDGSIVRTDGGGLIM